MTRFAALNMAVTKKNDCKGRQITMNNVKKLYGVKVMRLLKCQHTLAHQEGNKPDFRWCTLSKFLNIAGIF